MGDAPAREPALEELRLLRRGSAADHDTGAGELTQALEHLLGAPSTGDSGAPLSPWATTLSTMVQAIVERTTDGRIRDGQLLGDQQAEDHRGEAPRAEPPHEERGAPPAARISSATSSSLFRVRPARKTFAPSRAKARATAPPIDPPAP